AGDDETVAGFGFRFQAAIEVEIVCDRFRVVDRQRGAVDRARGDRVLPGPGQFASLPSRPQHARARLFVARQLRGRFVQLRLAGCQLRVEPGELALLRVAWQRELCAPGPRAAVRHETRLLDVGEERLHRVEV